MVTVDLSRLVELLGGGCVFPLGDGPDVAGVRLDHRAVGSGDLFAALPGSATDGARFVPEAVASGACAVLSPAPIEPPPPVPNWVHPEARRVAGEAAAEVLGRPSEALTVIAVTGTNGKTTVAHLCGQLLSAAGRTPAVLGTAGHRLGSGGRLEPAAHTTPDAPELQRLLARHRAEGGDAVALELSSHALEQERHAGLAIDVAVFTNLTRDHLDYHGDMERYAAAKERLFAALGEHGAAVVNTDDPASERMKRVAARRGARVITFSTRSRADLRASEVETGPRGTLLGFVGMGIPRTRVSFPLPGRFNVENALAATAAVLVSGASPSSVLEGLATVSPAPGRLERVPTGELGFDVFVDYAHTEDALRVVLTSLREVCAGRLICVFGCGGDRDPGKRAPMGAVVGELADVAVATSDNPRGEDPRAILAQVERGLARAAAQYRVVVDRAQAIRAALETAEAGDVVLIAGKGHETTQVVGREVLEFDDRAVATEVLNGLARGGRSRGEH